MPRSENTNWSGKGNKDIMNKLSKVILILLVSVMVGLVIPGCSSTQGTETDNQTSEAPEAPEAPDFQLYDLEGKLVSLSDLRGKPIMLNFWSAQCGPCVYEMPLLQQTYDEWSPKGLVLLTINFVESQSDVEQFLQKNNLSLPVLLDPTQEVARMYNAQRIPITYFIDKDGLAQAAKLGPFQNEKEIGSYLSSIMP